MNLIVWNIPQTCSEQEVREFLQHELGHYAKNVIVHEQGTSNAYAHVELNADVPYVGDVIAQQVHGKLLGGVALQASVMPFDEKPAPPPQRL
ncbi:RNA-binding protein [Paraburkholderia rhizosphaerae]|uniref:RNA recognition motif-containing protein n=1 Tax=Paraburkholderia rhizosphaerae TaxID=480658 RepID=A0A4R8L6I0_9BURK|nr:RNA-binding protein [Paraburkholderia rhizosphaerae]TDY38277.1 hypothetical protein BX592_13214 [Paraburkholderia rhizosphaerae]